MVCLGLEPGAAGWKAQTNPLSYGGTPYRSTVTLTLISCTTWIIGRSSNVWLTFPIQIGLHFIWTAAAAAAAESQRLSF